MPYPSQIDREQIIRAARQLIEEKGVDALSLSKLASTLGVKAPSLYRHVANKETLLQAVNLCTLSQLFATLEAASAVVDDSPAPQLLPILRAYRQFAHANPELYLLAMTTKPGEGRPEEDVLVQMVLPMQTLMAKISGEENSLPALRGVFALVHGYVLLELNQQLQRGGDLDETFDVVVNAYLKGWM